MSFFPHIAAIGNPFPKDLEKVAISGVMPKNSLQPPKANLNPVITSSKISRMPYFFVIFLILQSHYIAL